MALRVLEMYRDKGIAKGVFLWLDEMGRFLRDVEEFSFQRDFKPIAPDPENGWKRYEPLPDTHITLTFTDGTCTMRQFTLSQLRGEA